MYDRLLQENGDALLANAPRRLLWALMRLVLAIILRQRYRVEVVGLARLPAHGAVLLAGNHVSAIDWALLQLASPRPIHFFLPRVAQERWWWRSFMRAFGAQRAGARQDGQIRALLAQGAVVGVFPEGAISRTGQLGEFQRDYAAAVEGLSVPVVPFYLRGLWGSTFSLSTARLRVLRSRGLRKRIICAFGASLPAPVPADALKRHVFELSIEAWEQHTQHLDSIPARFIHTMKRVRGAMAIADTLNGPLSGYRLLTGVILISRLIRRLCREERVGLLLPTTNGGAIANLAAMLCGKVVVNLNYTASEASVQAAIAKASLRTVFTSTRFLDRLEKRGIDGLALLAGTTVHRLEDFAGKIPGHQRLLTLLQVVLLPATLLKLLYLTRVSPQQVAAILFSSGSEGSPKGVMLSHRNILANAEQISDLLNSEDGEVLVSTLPIFHAFGLTATILAPLVEGVPVVCHPDPTDAVGVAHTVAQYRGTVLFGTSTFFRLYARNPRVHPLMFETLRLVVAGAEKLATDVREVFRMRFGKEIFEGYGATETTPVASVNVPDRLDTTTWAVQLGHKPGTVGMPLPGSSFRIVDPDTLAALPVGTDGLILIGGTQVMLGYLEDPVRTAQAIVELDGKRWYRTGDKGHLDEDGFLTIVDRYSRFAKIGGEMVSLTAVEEEVRRILGDPELDLCAVNLPDARKGEIILLLVSGDSGDGDSLRRRLLDGGLHALMLPAEYRRVDDVPKLGSGKTDFAAARALAEQLR